MASDFDEPQGFGGVIRLFALILAVCAVLPLGAQEGLDVVDSLASAGRADEARTELESWWENQRLQSSRNDRQRGMWLRAVLTVDPRMASLDFQRLVLEFPGGLHSDEALLRLGLISVAAQDLPRAAGYFRSLATDYPRSPRRREAEEWLAEHSVAIEEAVLGNTQSPEVDVAGPEVGVPGPEVGVPDREVGVPDRDVTVPGSAGRALARYAVQVGAFESEDRAGSMLASINASGFQARIVRVQGSTLVHVRIGGFLDRTEAVELMNRVRGRGHDATLAEDVAQEEPMQ
jgi:hypothetical protein